MTRFRLTSVAALLGSTALLATGAWAQTPAPQPGVPTAAPSASASSGLTASGLRNQAVYGSNGQEIGRVSNVVIGSDNQAYAVMTGGSFGNRQVLVPANRLSYQNNRFVAANVTEEQIRTLPAYTQGAGGFRAAEDTYAVTVTGYTVAQGATGQGREATNITVQQAAPAIRVEQASPQVTVQQAQPQVSVRQAQPEILVRQPAPTVTVDIPQPEIIVRMPQPEVNVSQAQPQVQVSQAQPNVQVVQPAQPQVQVTPSQPTVNVQAATGTPAAVTMQQPEGQPNVRFERAEPRVTVNQAQGQPNVRIEQQGQATGQGQGTGDAARTAMAPATAPATATQPAATGTVAAGAGTARQFSVNQLEDMNVYNARGNELGDVEDVLIGPNNQNFLVVAYGGFLGLGERRVVLPLDRFQVQNDRLVIQGLTEDQLRALPAYARGAQGYRAAETDFRAELSPFRQ